MKKLQKVEKPNKVYPIIKVNYLCNLSCKYCFYDGFSDRKKGKMSIDMASLIMEKALKYNLARGGDHIKFYWHGGEPTLNGIHFFEKIVEVQMELKEKYGIKIENAIQTNGLLINPKWIQFFKENSFGIGVSIDGPSYINDAQRVSVSMGSTTQIILNNIKAIALAGGDVGVLSVITNKHQDALSMYEFYKENKIDGVGFCKCFVKNNDIVDEEQTVCNSNFAKFINEFFDLYYFGTYPISQREYEAIMRKIIKAPADSVCTFSGRTSCGMFPTINLDGEVFFCDDFDLLTDNVLGNVKELDFNEIFETNFYKDRKSESLEVYNNCSKECDIGTICGAGCPRHDVRINNDKVKNYYCEAFKLIIPHISDLIPKKFRR